MEARAGNSILDFETLFSDFHELLNGSGLTESADPPGSDSEGPRNVAWIEPVYTLKVDQNIRKAIQDRWEVPSVVRLPLPSTPKRTIITWWPIYLSMPKNPYIYNKHKTIKMIKYTFRYFKKIILYVYIRMHKFICIHIYIYIIIYEYLCMYTHE